MSRKELFVCECDNSEHIFIVDHFYDEHCNWDELSVTVHLNHYLPWYKRIIPCLKFVFGCNSPSYEVVLLSESDRDRLVENLKSFEFRQRRDFDTHAFAKRMSKKAKRVCRGGESPWERSTT